MLMVIFGAGASHDCDPQHPAGRGPLDPSHRPDINDARLPLTAELFADRFGIILQRHQRCWPLVPRLRAAASRGALERELETIREESRGPASNRGPQLADFIYYLRDVISHCTQEWSARNPFGHTGYAALLSNIEEWRLQRGNAERVSLITFNYDTLLETALRNVLPLFSLRTMHDYIANPRYDVIKLHGSIDWQRVVSNPSNLSSEEFVERFVELEPSDTYMTGVELSEWSSNAPANVPAIAIPMEKKTDSDFMCPPTHLDVLRARLMEVTHLLVIGWRGAEAHFLKMWRDIPRSVAPKDTPGYVENWPPTLVGVQVVDCSAEGVATVYANLKGGSIRCGRALEFEQGFSAYVDTSEYLNALLQIRP
jgi:SIR2-like domain